MSLFVASLAFDQGSGGFQGLDRLGVLMGSAVSGTLGYFYLKRVFGKHTVGA